WCPGTCRLFSSARRSGEGPRRGIPATGTTRAAGSLVSLDDVEELQCPGEAAGRLIVFASALVDRDGVPFRVELESEVLDRLVDHLRGPEDRADLLRVLLRFAVGVLS